MAHTIARLGCTNLSGADFGIASRARVKAWASGAMTLPEMN